MKSAAARISVPPPAALVRVARSSEGVLRLHLSNPPANALSEEVLDTLRLELAAAEVDAAVRVVILSADGNLFSAGHDLKQLTARRKDSDRGRAYFERIMRLCAALMQAIVRHPKPVIAEVAGLATAAGCQLVASCDLAIASSAARFQTPGVNIGLFCSTPMVALSRSISRKHAMEMLLTGEPIDATEALRIGLVNRVVSPDRLARECDAWASLIASKPVAIVKSGKEAFYRQAEMPLAEAYDFAARTMVENMLARDAEEGIGAFLEKRIPHWSGQ